MPLDGIFSTLYHLAPGLFYSLMYLPCPIKHVSFCFLLRTQLSVYAEEKQVKWSNGRVPSILTHLVPTADIPIASQALLANILPFIVIIYIIIIS